MMQTATTNALTILATAALVILAIVAIDVLMDVLDGMCVVLERLGAGLLSLVDLTVSTARETVRRAKRAARNGGIGNDE